MVMPGISHLHIFFALSHTNQDAMARPERFLALWKFT